MSTQAEDVLWTKLHVPQPTAGYVARPRLIGQIDLGLRQPGLVLLCAPAGFGKSALLAESCRHRATEGTAWLSLDHADNDPIRFWRHLAASLDQAGGDDSSIVESLDRVGAWGQVADGEAVVTALINASAAAIGDLALVLDDYHVIENEAIHGGVRYLIQHAPPGLRVLIASRADPPLQLPRLRSQGRLTEIRAADLRFDADESGQLLSALTDVTITDRVAATLADKTEGWAAGLQLAGLSVNGGTEPEAFAAAFTGEHRFVLDYLTEEVLDQQPAEQRLFLLQTSILDRLSGPLCGAVTGRGDCQQQLEAIEASNLFLVPLDDTRGWWRYHHLFADLLRVRLQQQDDDVAELHRRAADWYRENGEIDGAIRHAWAAGDGAKAAELIESNADPLLLRSEGVTLQRWLELLPAGLVDSRRLTLARARIAIYGGRLEAAEALLDQADQLDGDGAESQPAEPTPTRSSGPLDTPERTAGLLRAYLAHMRGDAQTAIDLAKGVAADTDAASTIGLVARWHIAAGPWLRGDVTEAEPALAANATDWRLVGQHDRAALSANRLGRVQSARGNLDAALETYHQILELDAPNTGPDSNAAGLAHIGIAEVAYQRNDLDTARVHVRLGISKGGDFIYTLALAAGWALLARIHHAKGDPDESREAMRTALKLAPGSDVAELLNPIPAQMARISIAQGDIDAAERWSHERPLQLNTEPTHQREPAELALARLAVAKGEPSQALSRLDPLRRLAAKQQRQGSLLEIEALRALALAATNDHAALDTLKVSVDLAAPSGYIRVFADEGPQMADLIEQLQLRSANRAGGDQAMLEAIATACRARARSDAEGRSPNEELVVPLTERELEVLAQLVEGKPNKQISDELFISLNTVKKHVTHIFDKLGVTNRTEATVRAREINLIP
ncbi:MAG: LuxR C-terminal-related transcriptional regulator [Actinomycetota bacterium]